VLAELPLAFLAFAGARRLLRATVAAGILAGAMAGASQAAAPGAQAGPEALDWARVGNWGRTCAGQSLRRARLAGAGLQEALPRSRAERQADRAGRSGRSGQPA
jgi:hypothetical protein